MNINLDYNATAFINVVNTYWDNEWQRDPWDIALAKSWTIRGRARRLLPADADTVATVTTFFTSQHAMGCASSVVDSQPLGLPGQKVAGRAPVPDERQVRRYLVVHWILGGNWNAIASLYFPIKVENINYCEVSRFMYPLQVSAILRAFVRLCRGFIKDA